MKINKKFVQDKPDEWKRLQADHLAFSRDRHLWRLKLARSKPAGAACAVGIVLIDRFGGVNERNPRGEVFPSQAAIAQETGLSDGEVRYGVDELRRLGLIATRKPALNKSLHYLFTDPDFAVSLRSEATATIRESGWGEPRSEAGTTLRSAVPTSGRSVVGTADNLNTEPEHLNLNTLSSGDGAAALQDDLPLVDHPSFDPVGSQGAEVPRTEEIDELLAIAIRDGDDTELWRLRDEEIRHAMDRRYGPSIEDRWWLVAAWRSGQAEWIDAIAELEKEDSDEEMRGNG